MHTETSVPDYVLVPIPSAIFAGFVNFVARCTDGDDPHGEIAHALETFLENQEEHTGERGLLPRYDKQTRKQEAFLVKFGSPKRGYQWQSVFLPNGTRIRMTYKGLEAHAEIRFGQVYFEKQSMSPSQFARRIAADTNRNAWRGPLHSVAGKGRLGLGRHVAPPPAIGSVLLAMTTVHAKHLRTRCQQRGIPEAGAGPHATVRDPDVPGISPHAKGHRRSREPIQKGLE